MMFDESTNSLDSQTKFKILNTLTKISKDKTVIYVTHDEEYLDKFDKIIEIKDGEIKANYKNHRHFKSKNKLHIDKKLTEEFNHYYNNYNNNQGSSEHLCNLLNNIFEHLNHHSNSNRLNSFLSELSYFSKNILTDDLRFL